MGEGKHLFGRGEPFWGRGGEFFLGGGRENFFLWGENLFLGGVDFSAVRKGNLFFVGSEPFFFEGDFFG